MKTCAATGCETVGRTTRGLCDRHYKQTHRKGLSPRPERRCAVDGCESPHRARGYCHKHYMTEWWEPRNQVEVICATCGGRFTPGRRRRKDNPSSYCSPQCWGVAERGPRSSQWRGGGGRPNPRNSQRYRSWRKAVLQRDGFRCTECGSEDHLEADHVLPFVSHPESRYDVENGRTLCGTCHRATPTYGRKDQGECA